jgi:hypothetical protein
MKLRATENVDASKVVKDIYRVFKTSCCKYCKVYINRNIQKRSPLSPLQALSIFVEASLSRKQYEIIRTSNKKLFPCYSILLEAKRIVTPFTNHIELQLRAQKLIFKIY